MKNNQSKKQNGIKEYMGFIEVISELGDAIVRYYPEDILERFKTGITPFCFESIEDYNDFISQLAEFIKYYEIMLSENPIGKKNKSGSQKRTFQIMREIKAKYPKQFDQLLLLHVLIENNSPYIIEACLKSLKGKNVYVERYSQDNDGCKYIEIASTEELEYGFLEKEPQKRGEYEIGLRKFTKEEVDFFSDIKAISAIEFLTPADFVYCAKRPEYSDALFFNLFSYLEFAKNKNSNETVNSLVGLVYRNIQFLNISKLKTLLLYRAMQYAEVLEVNSGLNIQLDYQESVIRELLEKVKTTKRVKIAFEDFRINIQDPLQINFEPRHKRKEVSTDFPPVQAITSDSVLEKSTINIKGGFELSTNHLISKAEEFLQKRKIANFFEQYERKTLDNIDINLRNQANVIVLREGLKQRIKDANPDLSDKELDDIYFTECQKLLKFLHDRNLVDVQLSRRFDQIVTAQLICDGVFIVQNTDLVRLGFSKNAIVYICLHSPERILNCMQLGYVKKEDLLQNEHISVNVIELLFNAKEITVTDILELVATKKIDITSLKRINIEDKNILKEQLDPLVLSKLYIDINRKRNEYENESKEAYEKALAQGIQEEDIVPTQRELELQEELQNLINQKNVYVFLFKYLKLKDKDRIDFCKNVFLGALDKADDVEFLSITKEIYEDGMLCIDQINDLDSNLFIALIKTGIIKEDDIKEFKRTAVLDEELEDLRELCDTEEEYLQEVELLRYSKLKAIIDEIIKEPTISKEEKIGIIYSIYTLDTPIEKDQRAAYESSIWLGEIDGAFDYLKDTYPRSNISSKKVKKVDRTENIPNNKKSDNNYLYPSYMIWKFMRLLDSNVAIRVYKDGNTTFYSEKLNRVMIEKVWKGNGKTLEREYGVATISMDLDTFDNNISQIVQYRRNGYRINTINAKNLLPVIRNKDKERRVGLIRHNKDLNHSGRKNWFELLLDNFGINLDDIRQGKDTRYLPEDADKIEAALEEVKDSYERV